MLQILSRTCFFIAIPYLYFLVGWLNFRQAGKSATLGALAILALSFWMYRKGKESRSGRLALLFVALLFLIIIAYQGFLRDLFGVAQDNALVMEAIFGTNGSESYEFVLHNSHAFLKHFSVLLGAFTLFALFVFRQPQPSLAKGFFHSESRRRTLSIVLISLFTLTHLNSTMRKENPLLYFPIRYFKWKNNVDATRLVHEGLAGRLINDKSLAGMSYAGTGPRTVVFVLGESSTRLNWSLYGYPRNTNPELQEIEGQLLKFSDVVTTDGSTVLDMQKILTPATRTEPHLFQERPNILTIARKAGYKTFWITNHSTDMTGLISIFATSADKTVNANRGGSRSEGSYDEVVLPHLQEALADPAPLKFILVHLLNAHPAYTFRYPYNFARFENVNDQIQEELQKAGRPFWSRALRDEYDNAILYSDHILRRSLALCESYPDQEIAWLYVPDHGEDVAHYSSFVGHNPRVLAMFEIPMLLWRSSASNRGKIEDQALSGRPYQTDQLDHTLLGLMGIKGDYYDGRRDILSESFVPLPRFVAGKVYPHP